MANLRNKVCFTPAPTVSRGLIQLKPRGACRYLATIDPVLRDFFDFIPSEYFDGRYFDPDDVDFFVPNPFRRR